jgi:hypothetical protein
VIARAVRINRPTAQTAKMVVRTRKTALQASGGRVRFRGLAGMDSPGTDVDIVVLLD